MRRGRRGLSGGAEFASSGEDSFVAVVVTKLTGALLFILLLTMMIMALLPKGQDAPTGPDAPPVAAQALAVATPEQLPDAVVGRPYRLALAVSNPQGPVQWSLIGDLPPGLSFSPADGQIVGVPQRATAQPVDVIVAASDARSRASSRVVLTVLKTTGTMGFIARLKPAWNRLPTRQWLEHGFGFLLIALVYLVGMNCLGSIARYRESETPADTRRPPAAGSWRLRVRVYRAAISAAALAAVIGLAYWLWRGPLV